MFLLTVIKRNLDDDYHNDEDDDDDDDDNNDAGFSLMHIFNSVSVSLEQKLLITKTRLFKYIEDFTTKNRKFSDKNSDISHISAQNIDCGYLLEPPRRGGSYKYPQSIF